jgi:hypothetical protein
LQFTVPFEHFWLMALVEEVGTLIFFIVTGYKFKPAANNPYLLVANDDLQMDAMWVFGPAPMFMFMFTMYSVTRSGVLENIHRTRHGKQKQTELTRQLLLSSSSSSDDDGERVAAAGGAFHESKDDVLFSQSIVQQTRRAQPPTSNQQQLGASGPDIYR